MDAQQEPVLRDSKGQTADVGVTLETGPIPLKYVTELLVRICHHTTSLVLCVTLELIT